MKIAAIIALDQPVRGKCAVTVRVHLAGLSEKMTIDVVVARDGGGDRDMQEAAIARAKDFARQFASQPR